MRFRAQPSRAADTAADSPLTRRDATGWVHSAVTVSQLKVGEAIRLSVPLKARARVSLGGAAIFCGRPTASDGCVAVAIERTYDDRSCCRPCFASQFDPKNQRIVPLTGPWGKQRCCRGRHRSGASCLPFGLQDAAMAVAWSSCAKKRRAAAQSLLTRATSLRLMRMTVPRRLRPRAVRRAPIRRRLRRSPAWARARRVLPLPSARWATPARHGRRARLGHM